MKKQNFNPPDLKNLRDSITQLLATSDPSDKDLYDVIVIGVGSMGSAAVYELAKRGAKVLGIEQFGLVHDQGSHSGSTRIIRKAYFEHPDYVPLLERAYNKWRSLEEGLGHQLYYPAGLAYFGEPDHPVMKGTLQSAGKYSIEVEKEYHNPVFEVPENFQSLLEPDAGFVNTDQTILSLAGEAIKSGARILINTQVVNWTSGFDGVSIKTSKGVFKARKLVITAGAYTSKLLPEIEPEFKVTRQVIGWFNPKDVEAVSLGNFPCWVLAEKGVPGIYYGFPFMPGAEYGGNTALKVAHHVPAEEVDPENLPELKTELELEKLTGMMNRYMPGVYESVQSVSTCFYTNSADEHFILDTLPDNKNVVIATGFSGHGFKFVPVIGEIISDLALENKTDQGIDLFRITRFE